MRYALRNQHKISEAYSPEILQNIKASLDDYFNDRDTIPTDDIKRIGNDEFKTLIVDDVSHSCRLIAFFVIDVTYDVYRLAFKEFIG